MSRSRSGFTLIELLVSIGLFSILVAIAAGGFVNALRTQRQVAAMMAAQSNVSIALEQMTREIRTGYLFCDAPGSTGPSLACLSSCVVDSAATPQVWTCTNFLEYYNASGQKIDYSLTPAGVLDQSINGGAVQAITGEDVDVKYLTFTLLGNLEGDHWNPRITISLGVAPNDSTITWNTAQLQTTVSARQIDCTPGATPDC